MNIVIDYYKRGHHIYMLCAQYNADRHNYDHRLYYSNHNLTVFHLVQRWYSYNNEDTQHVYRLLFEQGVNHSIRVAVPDWRNHAYPMIMGHDNENIRYRIEGSIKIYRAATGNVAIRRLR